MKPRIFLKYGDFNYLFFSLLAIKNPSKSLDFRISRFWRNQQKGERLGAVVAATRQRR
jgi:hypothetical protein